MTHKASARLAGVMFLAYIATGVSQLVMMGRVTAGSSGAAETLARYAANPGTVRVDALLTLLTAFEAVALGAAL